MYVRVLLDVILERDEASLLLQMVDHARLSLEEHCESEHVEVSEPAQRSVSLDALIVHVCTKAGRGASCLRARSWLRLSRSSSTRCKSAWMRIVVASNVSPIANKCWERRRGPKNKYLSS